MALYNGLYSQWHITYQSPNTYNLELLSRVCCNKIKLHWILLLFFSEYLLSFFISCLILNLTRSSCLKIHAAQWYESICLVHSSLQPPTPHTLVFLLPFFVPYIGVCSNAIDAWRHFSGCTHYSNSFFSAQGGGAQTHFSCCSLQR